MNNVLRIKELVLELSKANEAYYGEDNPIMPDREYDEKIEELGRLEKETGIIFANSPTKRVGGANKEGLKKVEHSKPMLSANHTKSIDDVVQFAGMNKVILSWKMDGLTLVLRYRNGELVQAITRGEEGLVGEDITHTVKYMRNVPKKVTAMDEFEVRGEGVVSWADFKIFSKQSGHSHPRNVAAGAVRALTPDKALLSHIDFFAFELIKPNDNRQTKEEQLELLTLLGFTVVDYVTASGLGGEEEIRKLIKTFEPENYVYPVDGIIAEYNDLAYGRMLGATAHHENRMIALKWQDELHETVFRGVELATTRTGQITLTAEFDPVMVDGVYIKRADLHSLGYFNSLKLGVGDKIMVYKANMIIPQIAENITKSGTFELPDRCPCCGSRLEKRVSGTGSRSLWCPNEDCIARNAQKIARFCDKDAMNMEGFTAQILEKLMTFGFVKNFSDLYKLEKHREGIITTPGFGYGSYDKMISAVENSRNCHLYQFLVAVGIPLMGQNNAKAIDEYFYGSWDEFEKAIVDEFNFSRIAGVSNTLSRNIYNWYNDKNEQRLWKPVLNEITFIGNAKKIGEKGNPFKGANVAVTGSVNGINKKDITVLLTMLGAFVSDTITPNTTYLIVGENPNTGKLAAALSNNIKLIMEGQFAKMLGESNAEED